MDEFRLCTFVKGLNSWLGDEVISECDFIKVNYHSFLANKCFQGSEPL